MKKERFEMKLRSNQNQDYYMQPNSDRKRDAEELLTILKNGINTKILDEGVIRDRGFYTDYIFRVHAKENETGEVLKGTLCINVANPDKDNIKILPEIEKLCMARIRIPKINYTRIMAGILGTAIVLIMLGEVTIISMDLFGKRKHKQELDLNNDIGVEFFDPAYEMQQAEKRNYEDLKSLAESGDKEAQEELARYEWEQQRIEEIKEEERSNGYIR